MPTDMALATEIERLLISIGSIQVELAAIYRAKREAVRAAQAAEIDRHTKQEQRLAVELQALLRQRQQILQRAKPLVAPDDTLEILVQSFDEPERSRLLTRIEQTRQQVEANRRESWVIWIVSKQSLRLFNDIRDLIANQGRKAPIYSAGHGPELSFGGAMLDASA
jgi:hypothetical protein